MANENLLIKLADDHIKFLHSPIWALIKFRLREYQERKRELVSNFIRSENWTNVARIQGGIDEIDEVIKLTERLDKDIKEKTLDVDVALSVIENK